MEDGVTYVAERAERIVRGREQSPDPAGAPAAYDFIVHDVFSAGSLYPALFTVGFWENARAIMKPGGVAVMVSPAISTSVADARTSPRTRTASTCARSSRRS